MTENASICAVGVRTFQETLSSIDSVFDFKIELGPDCIPEMCLSSHLRVKDGMPGQHFVHVVMNAVYLHQSFIFDLEITDLSSELSCNSSFLT